MNAPKLLKEPFVHFLVAGTALFAAYTWVHRGAADYTQNAARVVPVTANEVAWLKETWARQWQRLPSDAEVGGLIADYLREELLAREARELRLDENDMVVRRRLAQKMTFLLEDTVHVADPPDEELRRIYEARPERFWTSARVSFTQIYFNPERRGDGAAGDAAKALHTLATTGAPGAATELGDRSLLQRDFAHADERAVASALGPELARAVFELEPGTWHGPIASGYGLHLVWVAEMQKAQPRTFAEVRAQVIEEWRREKQKATDEQYFAGLLRKYEVVADESVKPLLSPLMIAKGAGR